MTDTGETSIDDTSMSVKLRREATGLMASVRRFLGKRRYRWPLYLVLVAILAMIAFWFTFMRDLPSTDRLLNYEPALPTFVRDVNGEPVQSFARERRVELAFEEFPPQLIRAFLAAEDASFFTHGGLDYPGLAAAVFDYVTKIGSGERARGGSTITQQVAKNLLLTDEYSITRKIREAILATRIESALTKQRILELYLNQIFLGRNAYGVQAASRAYFDKDVADLEIHEAAFLAGLPQAPSRYNPLTNPDAALARRNLVLRLMRENDWVDEATYETARALPLGVTRTSQSVTDNVGGYFMEEVRRILIDSFGDDEEDGPYGVYSGGLWVRTSYDPDMQTSAENALRAGLLRFDRGRPWAGPVATIPMEDGEWRSRLASANLAVDYEDWRVAVVLSKDGNAAQIGFSDGETATLPRSLASVARSGGGTAFSTMQPGDIITVRPSGGNYALAKVPDISGGMVVEDVQTGRVYAMQGGFSSRLEAFNRATQAERQPGSSIKPFVYAAVLENGMTPASIIVDGPFCVYQGAALGRKCFRNSGGGVAGPQTLRWGLEQSRNLMTVRAASETGIENVVELISNAGIGDHEPFLSTSLGAGDTTVLRLVNAYGMLANHGRDVGPSLIDYVQNRRGEVIYPANWRACEGCNASDWDGGRMPRPPIPGRQVVDAMTAFQLIHILQGVVQRGTATLLRDLDRPIFGKTGTTTGPTNVWFVGGTPNVVAGVYMGYDRQARSLGYGAGGTLAAPIFRQFMADVMEGEPVVPFAAPRGIRMVRIDRRSGRRVFGGWPSQDPRGAIIWEAFRPDSEPTRTIRRDVVARRPVRAILPEGEQNTVEVDAPRNDSEFLQSEGGIY
ncbi:penicillin-binding protein [Parasphingopyxis algicola]|uniref:penicillin-binding protein 1A n=1 Tax=Parasphingopyxis algicola TaxID=2026624 RepID=UPI0015A07F24|nr:transglycosylase domain-containing protein [Parasphingopyxis algicola]QLC26602.1 penicillin-binding protein [Parasphingopyxis algicola]